MADEKRQIQQIPCTEIEVNHEWNSRGKHWQTKANDEDGGFEGVLSSIALKGQDDPVTVIPNPDPKSKFKYFLAKGFRRYEAIIQIAVKEGNKNPTILAEVRNLDAAGARALNVRENACREGLTPPQLAWSIGQMSSTGMTDLAIAGEIGKTQGYVSDLNRIMKNTDPKITNMWRDAIKPVEVRAMRAIAKLKVGKDETVADLYKKQMTAYQEAVKDQAASEKVPTDEEREAAKVDRAKDQVYNFGFLMGRSHGLGGPKTDKQNFDEYLGDMFEFSEEISRKKAALAKAYRDGWKEGVESTKEAEEEESATAAQ